MQFVQYNNYQYSVLLYHYIHEGSNIFGGSTQFWPIHHSLLRHNSGQSSCKTVPEDHADLRKREQDGPTRLMRQKGKVTEAHTRARRPKKKYYRTYLKRARINPGMGKHVFRVLKPSHSLLYSAPPNLNKCKDTPSCKETIIQSKSRGKGRSITNREWSPRVGIITGGVGKVGGCQRRREGDKGDAERREIAKVRQTVQPDKQKSCHTIWTIPWRSSPPGCPEQDQSPPCPNAKSHTPGQGTFLTFLHPKHSRSELGQIPWQR